MVELKTVNQNNESDAAQNIEAKSATNIAEELEDRWLVRECSVYNDEYKECRSVRGRFQQYFVYGETQSCHQWKKDYDNCNKFHDHADIKAGVALIESEKARRAARLGAHRDNDTWRRRPAPPADWDRPLPAWMIQRDENTYLAVKAKELRGEIQPQPEVKSYCSVM